MNLEKMIICPLTECGVPAGAITLVHAESADIITVTVRASHGTKVRNYSAFQLLNNKPYVVDELCALAHWYQSGNVPVHWRKPTPERPHWWHSKSMAEQWVLLWFIGFALIVILSIAKYLGLYK